MSIAIDEHGVVLAALTDDGLRADLESLLTLVTLDLPRPPRIVLDLDGVRYFNSSCIARLLRLRQAVGQAGGVVVIAGASGHVSTLLGLTGLDKVFRLADTRAAAIRLVWENHDGAGSPPK